MHDNERTCAYRKMYPLTAVDKPEKIKKPSNEKKVNQKTKRGHK